MGPPEWMWLVITLLAFGFLLCVVLA